MNHLIYRFLSGNTGTRLELRTLMRQTARAFGCKTPKTDGDSALELLETYAKFTAEAAAQAIRDGRDREALDQKLFQMAKDLGDSLRWWMGLKNEQDALEAIVLLYRNIGITIRQEATGEFCVSDCYFSTFYSPEVCSVIESVDSGIFAGIYQGKGIRFRERITEGKNACRASFR